MNELLTRMFFGGFVRMHVLYHAVKEPIFGVEMMEELGATVTTSGPVRSTRCSISSKKPVTCPCTRKWSPASSGNTTGPPPQGQPPSKRPRRNCGSLFPRSCTTNRPDRRSGPPQPRRIADAPNPDRNRGELTSMIRTRVASAVLSFVLLVAPCGCEQSSPAASSQTPPDDLAARVKAVEDLIPSQSHMMADVGDHFTNLWFAGRAENWPLADFYLE